MSIKKQESHQSYEFESAGVYKLSLPGPIGKLELEINIPENAKFDYIALLGHPHPLHGGTMHNKVITTCVRAFTDAHIPSIRFNFRGVGESEGHYDAGIGESADLMFIAQWWLQYQTNAKIILAGFSFGSYVTYRALKLNPILLISVSPPVHHYDFIEFLPVQCPWLVIQGDSDDVVPMYEVANFLKNHALDAKLECFQGAGHFFHGRLIELKNCLLENIYATVA